MIMILTIIKIKKDNLKNKTIFDLISIFERRFHLMIKRGVLDWFIV